MDSSPHPAAAKSSDGKKLPDLIEQFPPSAAGCSDRRHAEKQKPNADDAAAFLDSAKARHPDLISGVNTSLPRHVQDKCSSFMNNLKNRFPSDENRSLSSFVRILSMYRDRSMSADKLRETVSALFSAHQDLLKEFGELLPDAYRIAPRGASPCTTIGAKKVRVDDSERGDERRRARSERIRRKAAPWRSTASKRSVVGSSEPLDTSNLEHCTPSYCILPKNYVFPVARYMTKLNRSVLNDAVVLTSKRKR